MIQEQSFRRETTRMAVGRWLTLAVIVLACGPSIRPCAGVDWGDWDDNHECVAPSFMFEDWCWEHGDQANCDADTTGCGTTVFDGYCSEVIEEVKCREGTSNINLNRYQCLWNENDPEDPNDDDCQCDQPNGHSLVGFPYTLCQQQDM